MATAGETSDVVAGGFRSSEAHTEPAAMTSILLKSRAASWRLADEDEKPVDKVGTANWRITRRSRCVRRCAGLWRP